MEKVFQEGPNSYELSYGLPGESTLEKQEQYDQRVGGTGINMYQKQYRDLMLKGKRENQISDVALMEHYAGQTMQKRRKRMSNQELILESMPHLREYARQRALAEYPSKARIVK